MDFFTGLGVGIALTASTAAFASDNIQAVLFPSKVHFLMNGTVKQIDGTGDDAIINYNNKAYIPLRTFAESMGAVVQYSTPSEQTGRSSIDIYSGMSESDFNMHDPDGYISYGRIQHQPVKSDNFGNTQTKVTGILKVKKPLTGKKIELIAFDRQGNRIGSGDVDMTNRLEQGDIISLEYTLITRNGSDVSSYQIVVKDSWALTTRDFFHDGMLLLDKGLVFGMGRIDPVRKGLVQTLQFKNQSKQPIGIQPFEIEYQVVKIDGSEEQLMFSHKLAPLQGEVPVYGWYEANIPVWNLKDRNGNPITPGKYANKIVIPDVLRYTAEDSDEMQSLTGISRMTRWEYDIKQSDIDSIR